LPDPPPASNVVPVDVTVEPASLRVLRFGGGFEFDEIKTDAHLLAGWEDMNFLGGLRDFSVELKPGVVLYPVRLNNVQTPDFYLPEERLKLQLRQPSFVEARTSGFIKPELNVFPFLVETNPDPNAPIVGYLEAKGSAGVDRPFRKKLYVSLAHNVQVEHPFKYRPSQTLGDYLTTLVLSYPELITTLDFRDDRNHPHKGVYLSNDLQVAGGIFGGSAKDVRVQPEVRTYIPITRHITFATRASIGFLFAANYGSYIQSNFTPPADAANANRIEGNDVETTYFRGFFSGGPNSNRGFPLRGIAPHGYVPFLVPATATQQIKTSCNPNLNPDPSQCAIPVGGFSLWELSNELRVDVSGPFSTAAFCDMSDVTSEEAKIRLDHLHLSCGIGARYDTPVGPLRLDIGYRVQPLQVVGWKSEYDVYKPVSEGGKGEQTEGLQPRLWGTLPVAISFGIGEAF
jgi:outer membrane protein insertion porin family/translocation and assembly module TamA